MTAELIVEGKQGHAAYPQLADNPIPKLARMLDRLSSTPLDAGTPSFQPSNVQATVISVPNTASNVIPSMARAVINVRYNNLHSRPKIEAWISEHCDSVAREMDARYTIKFSGNGDVFLTEPGPLVETMSEAVTAVTGRTAALTTNGGTSDARFIYAYCPVIEVGLRNATAHQVDEHVPVADLETLTRIYRHFLERYFAAEVSDPPGSDTMARNAPLSPRGRGREAMTYGRLHPKFRAPAYRGRKSFSRAGEGRLPFAERTPPHPAFGHLLPKGRRARCRPVSDPEDQTPHARNAHCTRDTASRPPASAISLISLAISAWPNASKPVASITNAPGPPMTLSR